MTGGDDVRMRGFRSRVSVEAALAAALDGLAPREGEEIQLASAAGRVLVEDVTAEADVPSFDRSAMDGWAVRAEDTFEATPYDPVALRIVGESMPGAASPEAVSSGRAVRIMTGAPVPAGADAVVPAESGREDAGALRLFVEAAVTPGKNVGRRGEDVRTGQVVLRAGRRLRPQDLGLLASVGRGTVAVVAPPRVRILVSGNELVAPGTRPAGPQIVDSNTPMLRALVERDGGTVASAVRLADDPASIREALAEPGFDVIVAAGGTSVGREDFLPSLVRELGRLDVHGVAMRPSSPTGIGSIGAVHSARSVVGLQSPRPLSMTALAETAGPGTRVFLLPGNPVSCLAAYDFFAGPAIRRLAGRSADWTYAVRRVRLAAPLSSQIGRTDYCRVTLTPSGGAEPLAVAGASVLSSATRADGFVVVPAASEGFPAGAEVDVFLYDAPAGAAP